MSNVQTRIHEALSKTSAGDMSLESLPLPPPPGNVATMYSLVPPPLTSTLPITFVSKGGNSSRPPYILPHPPPQKKRGVVITKLPGPLSSALSHTGDLKGREGSRHSSTSSMKSGDDPAFQIQSVKSDDAEITGFSSAQPTVITLSPSPTASLEEQDTQAPPTSHLQPHPLELESDKDTDSELTCTVHVETKTHVEIHTMYVHVHVRLLGTTHYMCLYIVPLRSDVILTVDKLHILHSCMSCLLSIGFTKLMSEETLASDPSSDGEGERREGGVCDGAGDQQQTQQPQKSNEAE